MFNDDLYTKLNALNNLKLLKLFRSDQELKIFIEKTYSLELVLILLSNKKLGMTELFNELKSKKPLVASFNIFLDRLVAKKICYKIQFPENMNKLQLKLTDSTIKAINDAYIKLYI